MSDVASPVFVPLTIVADEVIETAQSGLVTVSPILEAGVAAANSDAARRRSCRSSPPTPR